MADLSGSSSISHRGSNVSSFSIFYSHSKLEKNRFCQCRSKLLLCGRNADLVLSGLPIGIEFIISFTIPYNLSVLSRIYMATLAKTQTAQAKLFQNDEANKCLLDLRYDFRGSPRVARCPDARCKLVCSSSGECWAMFGGFFTG